MAASFNMIFTGAFLFVLIICSHGIMFIEGRALLKKIEGNIKNQSVNGTIVNSSRYILALEAEAKSSVGDSPPSPSGAAVHHVSPDDYRPTVPGHSPGAGHSYGPGAEGPY